MDAAGRLIQRQGELLQGYAHSRKRAAQLWQELEQLNRTVSELATRIEFEDEPSRHSVILAQGKSRSGGPA